MGSSVVPRKRMSPGDHAPRSSTNRRPRRAGRVKSFDVQSNYQIGPNMQLQRPSGTSDTDHRARRSGHINPFEVQSSYQIGPSMELQRPSGTSDNVPISILLTRLMKVLMMR